MNKKMSKKKKIIISAVAVLIVLIIAALIVVGNMLVNFALARGAMDNQDVDVMPESTLSVEEQQKIQESWQVQIAQAEDWLAASRVEPVQVISDDGLRLCASMIITDENSHKWLIAAHGYGGNRMQLMPMASHYGLRGYNALMPDLRSYGESEGKYIGMGWLDRKDMLLWIDLVLQKDPQAQIVLHGISMGGATVMMTAGEKLPENVKAIVEDCGYTSVWDIFKDELKYLFKLPAFPVLNVSSGISDLRVGYNFKEASAIKQVKKAQVPIMFIHGSEDNFVRTSMVYELYDACPTEKELLIVEGAGHGNSHGYKTEEYFTAVFAFLDKYVEG